MNYPLYEEWETITPQTHLIDEDNYALAIAERFIAMDFGIPDRTVITYTYTAPDGTIEMLYPPEKMGVDQSLRDAMNEEMFRERIDNAADYWTAPRAGWYQYGPFYGRSDIESTVGLLDALNAEMAALTAPPEPTPFDEFASRWETLE
jgi:hypothetical protein